jgi:hypothetical protein
MIRVSICGDAKNDFVKRESGLGPSLDSLTADIAEPSGVGAHKSSKGALGPMESDHEPQIS